MLCLPKLSLQRLKLIFSKRIILKPRIPISRKAQMLSKIIGILRFKAGRTVKYL